MTDDHLRLALSNIATDPENPKRWRELEQALRREFCAPLAQFAAERADVTQSRIEWAEHSRIVERTLAPIDGFAWRGYAGSPYGMSTVVHLVKHDNSVRARLDWEAYVTELALCGQRITWTSASGSRVPCWHCIQRLRRRGHDIAALMELRDGR